MVCLHAYECLSLNSTEGAGWCVTVVTLSHLLSVEHAQSTPVVLCTNTQIGHDYRTNHLPKVFSRWRS